MWELIMRKLVVFFRSILEKKFFYSVVFNLLILFLLASFTRVFEGEGDRIGHGGSASAHVMLDFDAR